MERTLKSGPAGGQPAEFLERRRSCQMVAQVEGAGALPMTQREQVQAECSVHCWHRSADPGKTCAGERRNVVHEVIQEDEDEEDM